jgi:hypothetical protein
MEILTIKKDNMYRRHIKKRLAKQINKINNFLPTFLDGKLIQLGPNIFYFEQNRGIYFYINDSGIAEGAIHCAGYRDVITYGLRVEHAESIKKYVFHDAIEGRGIFPLQTLNGSIPSDLRKALGFEGPEKDEFTTAKRWVLIK